MARPSKPVAVLQMEKRSHLIKSELETRAEYEKSLISGYKITERKEVKNNKIAHKEFARIKQILTKIEKADALYTSIINRYCLLYAECLEYEERQRTFENNLEKLEAEYEKRGEDAMTAHEHYSLVADMQRNINKLDDMAMRKRKMMLDIEKECVMTIAAALRAIPKKPDKSKTESDPMTGVLARGRRA